MPLYLALLISLGLHGVTIIAPHWLAAAAPKPTARIEARLVAVDPPESSSDEVSTTGTPESTPTAETQPPRRLEGDSLRRAQAALSRHLFYPPDAIAQGLEGEVILLLTVAPGGHLASAEIARSSGHALLDQAALDAAQHLGRLPLGQRQTLFPVKFRLN